MNRVRLQRLLSLAVLLGAVGALLWTWLLPQQAVARQPSASAFATRGGQALLPLPMVPDIPPEKIALGRELFSDVRLSADNTLACAGCHDLETAGHDRRRFSIGVQGAEGSVNAPTVFNAALNFAQFWDGRADSLEEQASGPVHNPVEMASSWPEVIGKLDADEKFKSRFLRIYPNGITAANLVDAIASFERTLLTTNAPFDRYLLGDLKAIGERAKLGYRRFKDLGCASCHQGVNIGGNMFQRFGIMTDYRPPKAKPGSVSTADLGRFNVTGREEDRKVFKVPGLRNVSATPPYFHDGSAATLDDAIIIMGRVQLGRELSKDEVDSLVAFLNTLTGERPASLR
jgi:cytochrome c peroxidase